MGQLTDSANKTFAKAARRASVPEWYQLAIPIGLVILAVFVLVSLILPGDEPADPTAQAVPVTTPSGSSQAPAEQDPSSAPSEGSSEPGPAAVPIDEDSNGISTEPEPEEEPTTPPDYESPVSSEPAVAVPALDGSTTTVPADSYDNARVAAVALFTGDFSNVPVSEGASAPVSATNPAATLVGISVAEVSPAAISFQAQVNVDGVGDLRVVDVTMVLEDERWVYFPAA